MKRKWFFILIFSIIFSVFLGIIGYFSIGDYLQNRFGPNTWIGDIYCTGRTVSDVNQELLSMIKPPVVTVKDAQGNSYSIDLCETDYRYDYTEVLTSFQRNQADFGWVHNLGSRHEIDLGNPAFSYDRDKLKQCWDDLEIVKAEAEEPILELVLSEEEGYTLFSTLEGHLDVKSGLNRLFSAVDNRELTISLKDAGCYFDYQMDTRQRLVYNKWKELDAMEQCGLVYDMGAEKIVFDEALMSGFIAKDEKSEPLRDENGKLYYDREAVEDFVEELCEAYHTYGVMRDFLSSRGEVVQVMGVTYGTELDVQKEKEFLWEYLSSEESRLTETVHIPVYIHEPTVRGRNDIGDTYVEVDMGEQKLYFYKEGQLMVQSDVVTGNLRTRHGTPEGVNTIYDKAVNTTLRGPGYASFVRRWMAVYRGIGLHDAGWREEFGGEIYKTDGSHGCVNLPDETADILYEHAEKGTPVIMYY